MRETRSVIFSHYFKVEKCPGLFKGPIGGAKKRTFQRKFVSVIKIGPFQTFSFFQVQANLAAFWHFHLDPTHLKLYGGNLRLVK